MEGVGKEAPKQKPSHKNSPKTKGSELDANDINDMTKNKTNPGQPNPKGRDTKGKKVTSQRKNIFTYRTHKE